MRTIPYIRRLLNLLLTRFYPLFLLLFIVKSPVAAKGQIRYYLPLLREIERCCLDSLTPSMTLYSVEVKKNKYGYRERFSGWLVQETPKDYHFLELTGQRLNIKKVVIEKLTPCNTNEAILEQINTYSDQIVPVHIRIGSAYCGQNYIPVCLVALWTYKCKNYTLCQQLFSNEARTYHHYKAENKMFGFPIADWFGFLYYNEMLSAYSIWRNYEFSAIYGAHLSSSVFKKFEYQETAIKLYNQLKSRTGDFKSFTIPNTLTWQIMKLGMSRSAKIAFLADRIHLLNIIQIDQPGGISYFYPQNSISCDSMEKQNVSYFKGETKYNVINPYHEILKMKLSMAEAVQLLPYFMDTCYIPTYTYFRDFAGYRNLHYFNKVIEDLVYHITNIHFMVPDSFNRLNPIIKKQKIKQYIKWCNENAGLT